MSWRPKEGWFEKKNQIMLELEGQSYPARRAYEAGADTMHQADMDYLEARECILDFSHKGHIRVTYDFDREDWRKFKGDKEVKDGKDL